MQRGRMTDELKVVCIAGTWTGGYLRFHGLIDDHDEGYHKDEPVEDCTVCIHEVLNSCQQKNCWCKIEGT